MAKNDKRVLTVILTAGGEKKCIYHFCAVTGTQGHKPHVSEEMRVSSPTRWYKVVLVGRRFASLTGTAPPAPEARAGPPRPPLAPPSLTGALRCGAWYHREAGDRRRLGRQKGGRRRAWRWRRPRRGTGSPLAAPPAGRAPCLARNPPPGPRCNGPGRRAARAGGRADQSGRCCCWLGARRLSLGGVSAGWPRLGPAPPPAHAQT